MKIKFLEFKNPDDASTIRGIEIIEDQVLFFTESFAEFQLGDKDWRISETLPLSTEGGPTSPLKPAVFVKDNKQSALLLLGSGKGEGNETALLMNLKSKTSDKVDMSVFYNRIKQAGLSEVNINSATLLNERIAISNDASGESRLIVTSNDFWKKQGSADIFKVKVEWEQMPGLNPVVTALAYSYENDWLILAANAERPAGEGESGGTKDAYLGIIENAYRKSDRKRLRVNEAVKLADVDPLFDNQTIESISIHADKKKKLKLHMTSIDASGISYLFKLRLKES
jgi:hypothetical protein